MGLEMGEGHKVQNGWFGSQCLTTGQEGHKGRHCRAGIQMPSPGLPGCRQYLSALSG